MQGCTTYIQPLQGCVHLAKDDHKVVYTLQRLMQGCRKLAATLQGCNNLAARLEISIWEVLIYINNQLLEKSFTCGINI